MKELLQHTILLPKIHSNIFINDVNLVLIKFKVNIYFYLITFVY